MSELDLYDYPLPAELIAKSPAAERDAARLLVLDRASGSIAHRTVRDLPDLLRSGDLLILNDTRVLPARLVGHRAATGGKWEGLFLGVRESGFWEIIGQTRGKLKPGEELQIPRVLTSNPVAETGVGAAPSQPGTIRAINDPLRLKLVERLEDGGWLVQPDSNASHVDLLEQFGMVPLPPYMERETATAADRERYQTLHAQHPGSVAAPTAGLHFTPELLDRCRRAGIQTATVTLHVGLGTFRPISADRLEDHLMHSEWCHVSTNTVNLIRKTREQGGRVVAIGTTSVRTLESASQSGVLAPFEGATRLFIRPGYTFRTVDVILTNFHLPKSTLLVLMSTFAGRELILNAYANAIAEQYRFFSYGDAMLVL